MIHHWNKAVGDKGDSMAVYGYIRVSARDQNEDRQLVAMHNVKVPKRNIYLDKQSGKDFNRPQYRKLLRKAKKDDLIYIKSIDRLGRNYKDILFEWQRITKEIGADIVVLDMDLLDTREKSGTLTGMLIADMVLQVMAYFAQIERESIHQRQAEGIAAAKAKGKHLGRKAAPLPDGFEAVCARCYGGEVTTREAATALSMSHTTFYRHFLVWKQNFYVSEGRLCGTRMV